MAFLIFGSVEEAKEFKRWAANLEEPIRSLDFAVVDTSNHDRFPQVEFPDAGQSELNRLYDLWKRQRR